MTWSCSAIIYSELAFLNMALLGIAGTSHCVDETTSFLSTWSTAFSVIVFLTCDKGFQGSQT